MVMIRMLNIATFVLLFVVTVMLGHEYMARRAIEEKHPASGNFVDVTKARLHYLHKAAATPSGAAPVVLIHGSSGSAYDMAGAFFDVLPDDVDVYAFDRPGIAWSENKVTPLEMSHPAEQARAIHEAVGKLGLSRPVIVGHSWGGAVATAYTQLFGNEITGTVSLAGVHYVWEGPNGWYDQLLTMPVFNKVFANLFLAKLGSFMVPASIKGIYWPESPRENYREIAAADLILRPRNIIHNSTYSVNLRRHLEGMAPHYSNIKTPFILATGDRDQIVYAKNQSHRLHAEIDGSELIYFRQVGHMIHHSQNEILAEAIMRLSRGQALRPGITEIPAKL